MAHENKKAENSSVFSVSEGTKTGQSIPSITKLLNRKSLASLGNKQVPPPPAPSSPPPASPPSLPTPENEIKLTFAESSQEPSSSTPEVGLNIEVPHEPVPSLEIQTNRADSSVAENTFPPLEENPHPTDIPPPKIQPASRRIKSQTRELIIWEPKILQNGKDPLGKGITLIMQKGASCALFLAISPPPPGAPPAPHFLATAAVMPNDKLTIWTGLKWDPTVVPEMWNFFIKSGSVELSPPGTQTALTSARNVVRAAFGIRQSEWLLLVRVGPINACRGVLAFVSKESLQTKLAEALPFLSASEQKIK